MDVPVPIDAVGLRLVKVVRGELILCEAVRFTGGAPAVETTLRRAAISGRVEAGGIVSDYLVDLLDEEQSIIGNAYLDANSYRALKTRWMRCRIASPPTYAPAASEAPDHG